MEYKNYNYTNKLEVTKMLEDNQNTIEVIIGAINGIDDQKWLEEMCIQYIFNENFGIARTAIYGIGDLARIHNTLIYKEIIQDLFNQVENERLKFVIQEVSQDLDIFLK